MTDTRISLHQVQALPGVLEPWAMYYVKAANSNYVSQYITWKTDQGVEITPIGKSAYQHWLDEGNVGDVSVFLASLKGKDGVSIHSIDGVFEDENGSIIEQNIPATPALSSDFTATFFSAQIMAGDEGATCDITYLIDQVKIYGPVTLIYGQVNSNNAPNVTIPQGALVSVRIDKIVGNVRTVASTLVGELS